MIKKSVINIVTVFIIFGILQISDYVGNLASAYFSNLAVTYIVYTFVHIGVALLMGIVYAKLVLKMSLKDIGMWTRFPERIWWGIGIVLPCVVSGFYLCFVEGRLIKTCTINITVIVFTICVGISAGVVEEFLFRGILFRYMKETWGVVMAVIVPSVLFALLHVRNLKNPDITTITLLMLSGTLVAILFSLISWISESIWPGVVIHSLWNSAIIGQVFAISGNGNWNQAVYRYKLASKNDFLTGGTFGIEAAVPAIITYLGAILVIIYLRKRKR